MPVVLNEEGTEARVSEVTLAHDLLADLLEDRIHNTADRRLGDGLAGLVGQRVLLEDCFDEGCLAHCCCCTG